MIRKFLSASVATALVFGSVTPAFAQSYAFAPNQAPLGATATVNFKVPLGAAPKQRKASYGLTVGFGQRLDSVTPDGRIATRQAKLADIRFTEGFKLWKAEVANFDLANIEKNRRMNLTGEDNTLWIVAGVVAAGVVVCLLADCFGGDDDDDDDDTSD